MTRRGKTEAMLRRYGKPVSYGGTPYRALIRPLQYKNGANRNLPGDAADGLHFLYTGPAAQKLAVGGTITAQSRNYAVKRCGTVRLGGEEIYVRAILMVLPSDADTEIRMERNGTVFARADSFTATAAQDAEPEIPWGGSGPEDVSAGAATWQLALEGIQAENGADLFLPDSFSVVIAKGGEKTVYSGCRWKSIKSSGGPTRGRSRSMEILAAGRTVEKEAESNAGTGGGTLGGNGT